MQNVGGVWLMTSLSHSPLMVALMQTATSLPVFLVVLPAAALADIVDRRRMLIVTQAWMTAAAAGLSLMTLIGQTTPWVLLTFTFALGLGSAVNMPVWQTVVPRLVPRDELPYAVALNSVAYNIARVIGPALGGAVVAIAGPGPVFLINAASFVGVMVVVYRWDRSPEENPFPAEHVMGAIRAGTRYTLHAPPLRSALIRCCLFIACSSALWALMPQVARHELNMNATGYGYLLGCFGTGALLGAAILPKLRQKASINTLVMAGTVVFAITTLALAYMRVLVLLYGAMVAGGVAWMATMSSLNVAAQTSAPSWVQSRALGFYTLALQGGMAVASVIWGAIAEQDGNSVALLCASLGLLVGLFGGFLWPLESDQNVDLRPSLHRHEHRLTIVPGPEAGPVMVRVEYRIDEEKSAEFVRAMHELGRVRRRNGARQWGLYHDLAQAGRYTEIFTVESWAEHLRQHARFTMTDREVLERVRSFQLENEPPVASHSIHVDQNSVS
jgi:MFS family permease